jgi:hypothetical protein
MLKLSEIIATIGYVIHYTIASARVKTGIRAHVTDEFVLRHSVDIIQ